MTSKVLMPGYWVHKWGCMRDPTWVAEDGEGSGSSTGIEKAGNRNWANHVTRRVEMILHQAVDSGEGSKSFLGGQKNVTSFLPIVKF